MLILLHKINNKKKTIFKQVFNSLHLLQKQYFIIVYIVLVMVGS